MYVRRDVTHNDIDCVPARAVVRPCGCSNFPWTFPPGRLPLLKPRNLLINVLTLNLTVTITPDSYH